jgi:hypothetical protein
MSSAIRAIQRAHDQHTANHRTAAGAAARQGGGEFTGLGWRFRPASGGGYNRPRVAITPGPCSRCHPRGGQATSGARSQCRFTVGPEELAGGEEVSVRGQRRRLVPPGLCRWQAPGHVRPSMRADIQNQILAVVGPFS